MSFQGRDLRDRVHGHGNARAIGAVGAVKYALAAAPSLPASREGLIANRRATMRADSRRKRYNDAFDTVTDATVARARIGLAIRAGKPRGRPQSHPSPGAGRRKKRRPDRDAIRARRPNPHATARGPGER
jgi:hypothetical protein